MGVLSRNVCFTATIFLLGATAAFIYSRRRRLAKEAVVPEEWKKIGVVKKVDLYPLKSGARLELNEAELVDFGLQTVAGEFKLQLRDRGFAVYGERVPEIKTARTLPKFVFIKLTVNDANSVALDAPGMDTLIVDVPKDSFKSVTIKCNSIENVEGLDCGNDAARWLSNYLLDKNSGVRLAYNDLSKRRDITKDYGAILEYYKKLGNDSVGLYSDLSSVHLINQRSVDDIKTKMSESDSAGVCVENFRPNLVVDGPEAFAEDEWEWLKIGDSVVLRNIMECPRCMFPTINPDSANRNKNREPVKTLEKFRKRDGAIPGPAMGLYLGVRQSGIIRVGDEVFMSTK